MFLKTDYIIIIAVHFLLSAVVCGGISKQCPNKFWKLIDTLWTLLWYILLMIVYNVSNQSEVFKIVTNHF